jgi:hypothetical protein
VQKPLTKENSNSGGRNLGATPKPASGDIPSHVSNITSTPVPPIPPSIPYFNPPTVSSSITQASDSGANTTASDNFVPDIHTAPTPHVDAAAYPHTTINRENSIGHFDWDQWDAVFGQHVAVDDPMMDMEWGEEHRVASETNDDMDLYDNH